jgi:hypothetical protein
MAERTMSKKAPLAPAAEELPLLVQPEAITLLLDGVQATAFTFAEPTISEEVRMLEELRQDLLGAVDVWPRLGALEQQAVTEAFAEHLGRLEASGWVLSGERQTAADGGTVLRFHALRRPSRRPRKKQHADAAPRGLLH